MKLTLPHRLFALFSLLLGVLFTTQTQAVEPAPVIQVDGKLNEPIWKTARPLEAFKTIEYKTLGKTIPAGEKPQAETTGLIATDANYLYLGFHCDEPMIEQLELSPLPRDGKIWINDCIEIYIAPFERANEYYQIIIDPAGQIFDALKKDDQLDVDYEISVVASTHQEAKRWTLEVAIPLVEIGLSGARDALMNFGRERKPATELTSWHGAFGKPETWHRLKLDSLKDSSFPDLQDWKFSAASPLYGENAFETTFVPALSSRSKVLLQVQEEGKWRTRGERTVQTHAKTPVKIAFPYELLPQNSPRKLRFLVENNGRLSSRVTYKLRLPSAAITAVPKVSYFYAEEKTGYLQFENFISDLSLQKSKLRLTIKSPDGKVQEKREIFPLKPIMNGSIDISSWREGTGTVIIELIANGKLLARQECPIKKRSGPFSDL